MLTSVQSVPQLLMLTFGHAQCSRFRNSDHGTRVRSAWRAAADADALVMVLDAYRQVCMLARLLQLPACGLTQHLFLRGEHMQLHR